jgi:hypothetical protein
MQPSTAVRAEEISGYGSTVNWGTNREPTAGTGPGFLDGGTRKARATRAHRPTAGVSLQ